MRRRGACQCPPLLHRPCGVPRPPGRCSGNTPWMSKLMRRGAGCPWLLSQPQPQCKPSTAWGWPGRGCWPGGRPGGGCHWPSGTLRCFRLPVTSLIRLCAWVQSKHPSSAKAPLRKQGRGKAEGLLGLAMRESVPERERMMMSGSSSTRRCLIPLGLGGGDHRVAFIV